LAAGQSKLAQKIDSLMEQASEALVQRRYFECERLAIDAMRRALGALDFDRVARIVLPLQEARRQIRDMAVDTGRVVCVNGELPMGLGLEPGMYLLSPPRVGVDGRLLREEATRREVPVVVLVREPPTRQGLWPIVAVGPVTVRTRIEPPEMAKVPAAKARAAKGGKAAAAGAKPAGKGKASVPPPIAEAALPETPPPVEWLLQACEALGDEAIESLSPGLSLVARVLALAERLEAVPDHEKLHQRLEEAAREAARIPPKKRAAAKPTGREILDDEAKGRADE